MMSSLILAFSIYNIFIYYLFLQFERLFELVWSLILVILYEILQKLSQELTKSVKEPDIVEQT